MAALSGQNIGLNFKGIINLGSTINSPLSGTLQAITDGDGVASPLRLSTTQARFQRAGNPTYFEISTPTIWDVFLNFRGFNDTSGCWSIQATDRLILGRNPSFGGFDSALSISQNGVYIGTIGGYAGARLHVTAAAASIAGRFEDNAGVRILEIGNGGYNIILGNNNDRLTSSSNSGYFDFNTNANGFDFNKQNAYTGSGTVGAIRTFYSINNHAGTVNGIFLNATETSLTGTTHNLMDLQGGDTGGLSVFRVSKNRVSAVRFETIVRLGGGSDTAQHYIYGGEGNSTGIVLNRANGAVGLFGGTGVLIGDSTFAASGGASARLHVKGNGTNPIALFEPNSSTLFAARISNNGMFSVGLSGGAGVSGIELLNGDNTTTIFRLTRSGEAGLVVQSLANIGFSLGNIFANAVYHVNFTRTGGGHILQTLTGTNVTSSWYTGDGSSNTGWIGTESNHSFGILTNNAYRLIVSNTGLLQLGGTTNAFPAIKRNGAAIEFVLADNVSGFCSIFASSVRSSLIQSFSGANNGRVSLQTWNNMIVNVEDDGVCIQSGAFASPNASAILQANSTTKGFLPPRLTTTERNAIASPAAGLIVYDRTLNKLYLYTTAWEEITSA
jgi:hypothetical protein